MKFRKMFRRCALQVEAGQGWYRQMPGHFAAFQPRSPLLIVTFDNMKSRGMPAPRYPWGWKLVEDLGHSHLGICMGGKNDWFRNPALFDFFDDLSQGGFFDGFEDVVFYGSSMGGYGALSFAAAAPGARVVAYVPQTTLCPDLAPFETRYRNGHARGDYDDRRYVDGADGAAAAREVSVFYDPYETQDRRHVDRLPDHNLSLYRCPHMGHKVPRILLMMDLLKPVAASALEGDLDTDSFDEVMGRRKEYPGYVRHLFDSALTKGHPGLVANAIDAAEARTGQPMPRYRRRALNAVAAAAEVEPA